MCTCNIDLQLTTEHICQMLRTGIRRHKHIHKKGGESGREIREGGDIYGTTRQGVRRRRANQHATAAQGLHTALSQLRVLHLCVQVQHTKVQHTKFGKLAGILAILPSLPYTVPKRLEIACTPMLEGKNVPIPLQRKINRVKRPLLFTE